MGKKIFFTLIELHFVPRLPCGLSGHERSPHAFRTENGGRTAKKAEWGNRKK